ncbi:hypothetical protein JOE61_000353 [Nocardioides salarius]|uniref:Uncharacterized protein n=1 Tax=Nocardioides salarius TaxID=374513 RepID=A0ABS2M5S4_9ACTN|nr:hypothetical protein [Nocardioides salarius]MBM7506539.1 hypothetical protein [Nocardioides salarius]
MPLPTTTCPSCIPVDATESTADPRWSVTSSTGWIDPARPLRGWRISQVSYDPKIGLAINDVDLTPDSATFGYFNTPTCRPRTSTGLVPYFPSVRPLSGLHAAVPDPACTCGYNVVPDLGDLLGLRLLSIPGDNPSFWAILRVDVVGRIARGAHRADPPGTIRCHDMALTGTVVVEDSVPFGAIELMARHGMYPVTVASLGGSHTAHVCPVSVG